MGENSKIAWTHHTFNPWVGCQRISPGCTNCYAESYDKRVGGGVDPKDGKKKLRWGPTAPRVRTSESTWKKPLAWDKAAREAGRRDRVFCSSLADVFEDRPELARWRFDLFHLIRSTPNLDWLLLTKRPENIGRLWPNGDVEEHGATSGPARRARPPMPPPGDTAWPNVWLGTTVEDRQRANERIPALLKVPAVVRFLSCEPLLERVDLAPFLSWGPFMQHVHVHGPSGQWSIDGARRPIDWVIIGGESGAKARPFHLEWARVLVTQSRAAGAAAFVKQMGERPMFMPPLTRGWVPLRLIDRAGGDPAEWPEDLRVREFPRP